MTARLSAARLALLAVLALVVVAVQTGLFAPVAFDGVAPDLVLLLVCAVALVRGPGAGAMVGLLAGLLFDLAPPADHVAGRWALALAVAGYVVGRLEGRLRRGDLTRADVVVPTLAGAVVSQFLFGLSALLVHDQSPGPVAAVVTPVVTVVLTLLAALLILPTLVELVARITGDHQRRRPARLALGTGP